MTHASRRRSPLLALLASCFAILALTASSAAAAPTINKLFTGPIQPGTTCTPTGTADAKVAASRSDFCVAFQTDAGGPSEDDISSQVLDVPAGYLGEPDRFPQCTNAQFNSGSGASNGACPANTQMGDARAAIRVDTVIGEQSLQPTGPVYNLEHGPNEVARLGIELRPFLVQDQPRVRIIVRVTLRPSPDVGLRSIIENMPRKADTIVLGFPSNNREVATDAFALRFWGSKTAHPSMPRSYGLLGSNCIDPQVGKVSAKSYGGVNSNATSNPYNLTDCDSVPFEPSAEYKVSDPRPDVPTETEVKVKFAEFNDPKTSGTAKKTVNTLPEGLGLSAQIASGAGNLKLCSPAQFAHYEPQHSVCPPESKVGKVEFTSPLQADVLTGEVYLGTQPAPGELPLLFFEAETGPAVDAPRIKLVGTQVINENNQIVATIDNLPQLLVNEFKLTFRGGDNSAIVTPPTCGTFNGGFSAYGYADPNTAVSSAQTLTIDQDCEAVKAFAPSVAFASANPVAGGTGDFTTVLSRPDRSPRIKRAQIDLPPGSLANLKGVPECSLDAARAGGCPAETKVGTIVAQAGVGPAPYTQTGDVFLTQREQGAVAGLAFSVPVAFGEVNLGQLNIVSRIEIRSGDLGLRVISDVPERFKGNPLNLRSMAITLNRQNFPLNPTNCGDLTSTSVITPNLGDAVPVNSGFKVGGCEKLDFKPEMAAAVNGETKKGGHPSIQVQVKAPEGTGALRQAFVELPTGIGFDLKQATRGCEVAEFVAGGCTENAVIGKVGGTLAITEEPLAGRLFLLRAAPGDVLPGIGLSFEGRFSGRVVGKNIINTKTDRLVSQFPALPDLPLTSFRLDVNGGSNGAVLATAKLCAEDTVVFDGNFVSHSGPKVALQSFTKCGQSLSAAANNPKVSGRLQKVRGGRPNVFMQVQPPAGKKITEVKVGLPKSYRVSTSRAKSSKYVSVSKLTVKGKLTRKRITSKSENKVRISLPKAGTTRARVVTRSGLVTIPKKSVRRSKKKVSVSVAVRYTDGTRATLKLKLTPR